MSIPWHGWDFDGAFPVFLAQLITGKSNIFDVFDWIDDGEIPGS